MANGFQETPEAARERLEREQQAQQERRAAAERTVDDNLATRDRLVGEYFSATENVKPSPTQRECDLLKLGIPLDEREPSGAEPEDEFQARVMEARLGHNNPYETRAVGAGEQPRRGRGRPRNNPDVSQTG